MNIDLPIIVWIIVSILIFLGCIFIAFIVALFFTKEDGSYRKYLYGSVKDRGHP